jgi:hypothetical protein
MQRVTIIPADGYVSVDGRAFNGLNLAALDPQIHAVQWTGTSGEMELLPDTNGMGANIVITSLAFVQPALDAWQAAADAADAPPPPLTPAETAVQRITALSTACEVAIVSGFTSDALGTSHTYQSDRDDQLNLIGAVSAAADMPFKCADATGAWGYRLHTAAQLRQVLNDGAAVKLTHLQTFGIKRTQVDAIVADATLTDNEKRTAIDAVVW